MAFFRVEREDEGTERQRTVVTRQVSVVAGSVISSYGYFWLNHTERGSVPNAASFLASALGTFAVLCPVISEAENSSYERAVVKTAEGFINPNEEAGDI